MIEQVQNARIKIRCEQQGLEGAQVLEHLIMILK